MVNFGEFEVEEGTEYGNKVPSLKEITLLHLKKIADICCQEFTAGYWQEKPLKIGGGMVIAKHYVNDVRESYINAVDFLIDIIIGYCDKDLIDKIDMMERKDKESKLDVKEKLANRKVIFREINKMFVRTKYFDTMTGRTETSGR